MQVIPWLERKAPDMFKRKEGHAKVGENGEGTHKVTLRERPGEPITECMAPACSFAATVAAHKSLTGGTNPMLISGSEGSSQWGSGR